MADNFDRQLRRYSSEVRHSLRQEELHDAYRAGRVTFRFSADRGLEYLGSDAERIVERYRR
jgi:hypothetical protein